jgi:dUTP pyrophosphatase
MATILSIKRFHPDAQIPKRQTEGSAGYDLHSVQFVVIAPRSRELVDTGIGIHLPQMTYGRVAPRSGMSVKQGVIVGAGVIDSDWTSAIKVLLFNTTNDEIRINIGDRIAQLIIERIELPMTIEVDELPFTKRGDQGFGSTGK